MNDFPDKIKYRYGFIGKVQITVSVALACSHYFGYYFARIPIELAAIMNVLFVVNSIICSVVVFLSQSPTTNLAQGRISLLY